MMKPLEGIVVLDQTRVLAGPFCTMFLGEMGAEVIKIEEAGKGDETRGYGPPFLDGESAYFMSINRNKKSITINAKHPEGLRILHELAKQADVYTENFRPGTADKLGMGYEKLNELNPRLIYASVSGFGHTGPERLRPGYDVVVQGMGGVMSLTGESERCPVKVGVSQADMIAGLYAFQGILLALIAREKTGKGQKVDIAMMDGQASLLTFQAGIYFVTGQPPRRMGNRHPTITPYETFDAADGCFNLAVGNDRLWVSFCDAMSLQELKNDPRFAKNQDRVAHREELSTHLKDLFRDKPVSYWIELFDRHGIPSGPILTLDKVLTHPQIIARDMVKEIEHPKLGKIKCLGNPIKLSNTPGYPDQAPPLLGQHTAEVLQSHLGLDKAEIDRLYREGVL